MRGRSSAPTTGSNEDYGEWQTLHDELLRFMLKAREQGKEQLEDYTLGMLDFVTGWCSERMRLD